MSLITQLSLYYFTAQKYGEYLMLIIQNLDAEVMEAITKGPAFGDGKLLHAYVL